MILANKIQKFLQKQLQEIGISRKDFAQKSSIPYPTVNKLINAAQLNPDLITILKIAVCFNCTIDKVTGRKDVYIKSKNYKFNDISLEEAVLNLKNYINNELQKNSLNPYKLSRQIGFSEHSIIGFVQNTNHKKILGSAIIVSLADYFKVSIDEMIGRVSTLNHELQTLERNESKSEE